MKKKAFTLVELLVVISIIALLLSVLMPSLQKARLAAKEVICISNMHQLGIAALAYENSNGRLPAHVSEESILEKYNSWPEQLTSDGTHTGGVVIDNRSLWIPYLSDLNFLTCPLLKKVDMNVSAIPLGSYRIYCSYAFFFGYYRNRATASERAKWADIDSRWTKTSQNWKYMGKRMKVMAGDRMYQSLTSGYQYRVNHGARTGIGLSYSPYDERNTGDQAHCGSVYSEYTGSVTDLLENDLREKTNAAFIFKDGSAKKFSGSKLTSIEAPTLVDNRSSGTYLMPVE